MKRPAVPTLPLTFLALLLLAVADLALVGQVADAVDEESTPAPDALPEGAFLTGRDVPTAKVQGVLARIEETEDAFLMHLTNAGEETRSVDLEAVCYQMMGSPMSRMGMQREEVAADRIVATIAPGQTLVQKLACAPQKQFVPEGMEEAYPTGGFEGGFSTTDFEIFAGGTPPEARRPNFGMGGLGQRIARGKKPAKATPPKVVAPLARLRVSRPLAPGQKVAAVKAEAVAENQG
ncbi:MAG: hypothetical protein P1V51_08555 [Deltaproteobacteria bacterium]|nr:hypothetical protein [Deltaproteobacteria bacterium]